MNLAHFSVTLETGFNFRFEAQKYYNKNLNLLDRYILEMFIYKQKRFRDKPFFYQLKCIIDDTGFGRRAIDASIKKFTDLGIIEVVDRKDKHNKKFYKVSLDGYLRNLDNIYDFSTCVDLEMMIDCKENIIKYISEIFLTKLRCNVDELYEIYLEEYYN